MNKVLLEGWTSRKECIYSILMQHWDENAMQPYNLYYMRYGKRWKLRACGQTEIVNWMLHQHLEKLYKTRILRSLVKKYRRFIPNKWAEKALSIEEAAIYL